ncbi:MAG: hypothetical protein WCC21_02105 [Candidatus Acidiferrales bacterium]
MKHRSKEIVIVAVILALLLPLATFAQFGGVVFDPTNYSNALLRYYQLEQHLIQLRNTYAQIVAQYNFALQMAQSIPNMPQRYLAQFSPWHFANAPDVYSNTGSWISGVNSGTVPTIMSGYQQATSQLLQYTSANLSLLAPSDLERVKAQYASVELADGANTLGMATIGSLRASTQNIDQHLATLEQDSLSSDPSMNTEIGVLNKVNAANVLGVQTNEDTNKLLAALLEQQTVANKQFRDQQANAINAEILRQAQLQGAMTEVLGGFGQDVSNYQIQ